MIMHIYEAMDAVRRYNRAEVMAIDAEAAALFRGGVADCAEGIEAQVRFVLSRYQGLSRPYPVDLPFHLAQLVAERAPDIKRFLHQSPVFEIGVPFTFTVPSEAIFNAFLPLRDYGQHAPLRCMTKMLHLANPKCVPVIDRWVAQGLAIDLSADNPRESYAEYGRALQAFGMSIPAAELSRLRFVDGGRSWSDTKLLDKVLLCRKAVGLQLAA